MTRRASGDPLDWLFGLEFFGIKLGLDNITALVDALGHPERQFVSVHVAGTNGKGSVTAMIDHALQAAGYRSGRYTSPHLVDLAERFSVNGTPVATTDLVEAVGTLRDIVNELHARGTLQHSPTFFEATTATAFELFRRAAVDVVVCEVGLGGRLDATNVLTPAVSVITSIGLDHQQHLGATRREIAGEKAGIIKPEVPVVIGRLDEESASVIADIARDRRAPLIESWRGTAVDRLEQASLGRPQRIRLRTSSRDYGDTAVALAGQHQIENAVVAVRTLEILAERLDRITPKAIIAGLATAVWPGRLDLRRFEDGREILLDAAHNPDGAVALARTLAEHPDWTGVPLVFTAMQDKDAEGMLRALAPAVGTIVLTRASSPRTADPNALATIAQNVAPARERIIAPSPQDALQTAWRLSPRIIVAGSIFLIGDVIRLLETP